jgi:hypothetical protein
MRAGHKEEASMRIVRRMILWGTVAAGLGLAGCSNDDGKGNTTPPPKTQPQPVEFTCSARLAPVTFEWIVDGQDRLVLTDPAHNSLSGTRKSTLGAGARPVYGTWALPTAVNTDGPIKLTATPVLTIDANSISVESDCTGGSTSLTARVSSPAVVTDTTVQVLSSANDVETGTSN